MSDNHAPEKHRVQMDFSAEALRRLDLLQDKMDATSRAEVVRHALGLLDWVVDRLREGHGIMLQTPTGQVETVHFPWVKKDSPWVQAPGGVLSASGQVPPNGAAPARRPRQSRKSAPPSGVATKQPRRSNP